MKPDPLRVVIADDEKHLRSSFRILIQNEGWIVVGEATNGQEAIHLYRKHKPDLLLLDINMPIKSGDEALIEIRKEFSNAKAIILTMESDAETVKRCIRAGAISYLTKNQSLDDIQIRLRQTIESLKPSGE
jgi:DNA-binding NarL/FixJ family response regulator